MMKTTRLQSFFIRFKLLPSVSSYFPACPLTLLQDAQYGHRGESDSLLQHLCSRRVGATAETKQTNLNTETVSGNTARWHTCRGRGQNTPTGSQVHVQPTLFWTVSFYFLILHFMNVLQSQTPAGNNLLKSHLDISKCDFKMCKTFTRINLLISSIIDQ